MIVGNPVELQNVCEICSKRGKEREKRNKIESEIEKERERVRQGNTKWVHKLLHEKVYTKR